MGRFEEAINSIERAEDIWKNQVLFNFDKLVLKIQMGKKEEVLQTFNPNDFAEPVNPAILYTLLEMPEEAAFWLEKGYRERSLMMVMLKHFWVWDPIRDDPRFIEIYDRMNFAD